MKALFFLFLSLIGTSAFPSDVPTVDYVATPIIVPGDNQVANGISNSGLIVGSYEYGHDLDYFLYDSKSSSSTPFLQFTVGYFIPTGVNNSSTIIGFYDYGGPTQGYIGTPGALVPLTFPGSTSTEPRAINDAGVVVGFYLDATNARHGFIYQPNGGFQTIVGPNGEPTSLEGINDLGQIFGSTRDGYFLLSSGAYTFYSFSPCGGVPEFGDPTGINDSGVASGLYGVLFNTATNSCIAPAVHGTKLFAAVGINNSGALIAQQDGNIYTPAPEPGSLTFTLGGGTILLLCIRQTARKRSHSA